MCPAASYLRAKQKCGKKPKKLAFAFAPKPQTNQLCPPQREEPNRVTLAATNEVQCVRAWGLVIGYWGGIRVESLVGVVATKNQRGTTLLRLNQDGTKGYGKRRPRSRTRSRGK